MKVVYLDGYSSNLIPPFLTRHGFKLFRWPDAGSL